MPTRKLLILTASFLALLAFVVFYERHQPTTDEANRAKKKLVDFKPETLERIVVERQDLPKLDLHKKENRWILAGKTGGPADSPSVDSLVSDLNRLEVVGETLSKFDPKEFGLEKPRVTVTLSFKDGSSRKVLVGNEIPGTDTTAAAVDGQFGPVRFAPTATLLKPLDDFRSKSLFEDPPSDWTRITIQKGPNKVVLGRAKNDTPNSPGTWMIEEPVKDLASRSFLEQITADLAATRISEFPPANPVEYPRIGLKPPLVSLTIQKEGDVLTRVGLGAAKAGADGKIYGLKDELLVLVDDRAMENLGKEFSAFREGKVLPVDAWTVDRMSFEMGDSRLGAEKVEGQWRTSGKKLSSTVVSDFLDRIGRVEAKAFFGRKDYAAYGIQSSPKKPPVAVAKLEIRDERKKDPWILQFYSSAPFAGEPAVAVEVSGRGDTMLIERSALSELNDLAEKIRKNATATPAAAPVGEVMPNVPEVTPAAAP